MMVFHGYMEGLQVVLHLANNTAFKTKKAYKEQVINRGGVISYIITKKTTHIVISNEGQLDSYKCQQARKLHVPIVSLTWLSACAEQTAAADVKLHLMERSVIDQQFDKGEISALKSLQVKKRSSIRPESVPVLMADDKTNVEFPENFVLVKSAVFQKSDAKKQKEMFAVVELQLSNEGVTKCFRISTSKAWKVDTQCGGDGGCEVSRQHRLVTGVQDALVVFSYVFTRLTMPPVSMEHIPASNLPLSMATVLGSRQFLQAQSDLVTSDDDLQSEVRDLMEVIWGEALGSISEKISVNLSNIKNEQIDRAEVALLELRRAVSDGGNAKALKSASTEFYNSLRFHLKARPRLTSIKDIAEQQDFCQLVRDIVGVSEAMNYRATDNPVARYRALRCHLVALGRHLDEFKTLETRLKASDLKEIGVQIHNIFSVSRGSEDTHYELEVGNHQQLFHASHPRNFVGILSRGLLLPKMVVEDFGGKLTDPGFLGPGIYFSDSISTCTKYSAPSARRGTRFMLICKVALGSSWETEVKDTRLTAPPAGHQSVHGVRSTNHQPSQFQDDEYVVYRPTQQRARYLVEYTVEGDTIINVDSQPVTLKDDLDQNAEPEDDGKVDTSDVKSITDPLTTVKAGLRADGDAAIPLKSVHIRGELVDLAAQVVVLQEYTNISYRPIEAKYVFPLDDMAAVCGFEAFINGKHIVGVVKEKEKAHQEYQEAVAAGHGAYLMDEEKPNVFTVSVGNLPPRATVLIRITYVAELRVDAGIVTFSVPGSVAPWDVEQNLEQITQTDVDVVKVNAKKSGVVTLQLAVRMPFVIRSITSPTHNIKMKNTDTMSVVELPKKAVLGAEFRLLIGLAEIHVPRMWVEQHPSANTRACMLTFYPEFEADCNQDVEVIFLVDVSNSMGLGAYKQARKVVSLALELLPNKYTFNLVTFGTGFHEAFPRPQKKTSSTIAKAHNFIMAARANQGNTDLWRPLQSLTWMTSDDTFRNVYVISDGHFSSDDVTIRVVTEGSLHNRVFTLGVGPTANHHMLRTVATAGRGSYEFYDDSTKSNWEGKLDTQLDQARQPSLSSVEVDWEQHGEGEGPPEQAPRCITSLFSGARQVIYGFMPNCTQATLKAVIGSEHMATMVSCQELQITTGKILHTMTARAIIRDWTDGMLAPQRIDHELAKKTLKNRIIDLSTKFSIVTKFTSFVAVEKREPSEESGNGPSIADLVERDDMDILPYMSWQVAPLDDEGEESENGSSNADMEDCDYMDMVPCMSREAASLDDVCFSDGVRPHLFECGSRPARSMPPREDRVRFGMAQTNAMGGNDVVQPEMSSIQQDKGISQNKPSAVMENIRECFLDGVPPCGFGFGGSSARSTPPREDPVRFGMVRMNAMGSNAGHDVVHMSSIQQDKGILQNKPRAVMENIQEV